MTLHLGKRPATYDARDYRYADVRPANLRVPQIPRPYGGFGRDFNDWFMLGNGPDDTVLSGFGGAGDCFFAGQDHSIMEAAKNAQQPMPSFTGKEAISDYSAYSGFDPQTGANDNGTDAREGLRYHQQQGMLDADGNRHKIGVYIALEPGNLAHAWELLWMTECLGVGLDFPQSAMDQFNAGQTWSVVPGSPSEGGHWIILVGHPVDAVWTGVTWGRRQTMTPTFLKSRCDELWAWIDAERYNAVTGLTFEHHADADLERYFTQASREAHRWVP